jgi:Zn-dependent protease with chaperone function
MEKQPTYTETYGALTPPQTGSDIDWLDRLMVQSLGGKECWVARRDNPQEAPLIEMTARLCPKMGVQVPPELIIYTSQYPNAASIASSKVVVSEKLLDIMTPAQVESVMAHELSHHRHKTRDNIAIFGGVLGGDYAYQKTLRPKLYQMISGIRNGYARAAAYILTPVAEFLSAVGLVNLYQQKVEYEADRESAQATGHPQVMADALNTLGDYVEKTQGAEREKRRASMSETAKVLADTYEKFEPRWVRRIRHNPFEVMGSHPPMALRVETLKGQEAQMHAAEQELPDPSFTR